MQEQKFYNLTNPQKSIWVTEEYFKGSAINNICGTALIKEKVNFDLLKKAINIVLENNDIFKIKFSLKNDIVTQYISDYVNSDIELLRAKNYSDFENQKKEIVSKPFNLFASHPYKFYIFKLPNRHGAFLLNIHHILADSWTLGFISKEILKTYSALIKNEIDYKCETYSYIDYISSENEYKKSLRYEKDKKYWNEEFMTIPELPFLPGSIKSALDLNDIKAKRMSHTLNKSFVEKISVYCKENNISLYNFFLAIYAIYIHEISGLSDFVIGTPILNRTNYREKHTAGMFINVAPLRINFDNIIEFKDFIKAVSLKTLKMFKHQKYSYQSLLEDLRENNKNTPNLYNILFSYQITSAKLENIQIKHQTDWTFNGNCAENLDIQILDINDTGNLNICYDYKTSIYTEQDINSMHNRIINIINQIISKENVLLSDIEVITPKEKKILLNKFNKTKMNFKENNILELFDIQVKNNPSKIAVVANSRALTYKELDDKSNMLAKYMMQNGIHSEDIVGLMLHRSLETAVGLLAILKCGATYLPIDPEYPIDRINYMMENSGASFVLVNSKTYCLLPNTYCKIIIDLSNTEIYNFENSYDKPQIFPYSLAYLIYTSGSTGKPKGVKISHKNLYNFVKGMNKIIKFNKHKTMVSVTTICFDIFGLELWCSLCFGLKLVIANEEEQNSPELLNKLCLENGVNIIQTTPSRFSTIFEEKSNLDFMKNITEILVGGEPLNDKLLTTMKNESKAKIYNVYGPTETTIWSTSKDMTNENIISVGKPIANTQIYILNPNKKLLPINVPGELYIGGDGVSAGYMNRPDLTNKNFIDSPFIKGNKIYNTNDLAYFTDSGEIVHLGRTDFQVKVRGYRVELGEIEEIIQKNPNIINTCVSLKKEENGHEILVAYYTTKSQIDSNSIENSLKASISDSLPNYMMPNFFVRLNKMPYTQNGKIDRKSLPLPDVSHLKKELIKPRNDLDNKLIKIIEKILNISNVSMLDTLMSLGGDSLSAISLSTKISTTFNVHINIKNLLEFTIKDLSDYIKNNLDTSEIIKIEKAEEKDFYPLSSAQRRIYYNTKMINEQNTVYNLPGGILADKKLDKDIIKSIFEQIIERHSILRTSFVINENEVMQKISNSISFDIPVFYNSSDEINSIIHSFSKHFNLENCPLFRIEIHYIDNKKTLLLFETHHIIMDGTSLNNLIIEFSRLYNGENLKTIPIEYKDYSVWENNYNNSPAILPVENYWLEKFKDSDFSELNLPYDFKQSVNRSFKGNKITKILNEKYFKKISEVARINGVSSYMLFLSAFFILLYKYTNQDDITIGIPFANREINETKRMIGMFVNNIVARKKIDQDVSFKDFLDEIKNQELNDLSNGSYPFDMLVKKLGITGASRNPLFDVMFIYQNNEETFVGNRNWEIIEIDNNISKFNLSLEIKPTTNKINLEYRTDLFKKQTVEQIYSHYINILKCVTENINIKISNISVLSKNEKNKILNEFNNTNLKYPKNKTISQLFETQVEKTPNRIALVFENTKLTYKELNEKSNQVANYIRNKNIKPNDIIGIMLPRSLELLISIIGVLKSGACYIPIDPTYPQKRIDYMLENSNAKLLITTNELYNNINFENKLCITDKEIEIQNTKNLDNINNPEDLSYIIYTSGSTGLPKGVMLKHNSLTNLSIYLNKTVDFLKDNCKYKNMASVTTASFDIFIFETLICLQKGLKIIIANEDEQRIPALLDILIKKNDVQLIQMTPSRMQLFLDNIEDIPHLSNLKYVTLAGEPLPLSLRDQLLNIGVEKVYNGYGPSETTVFSSFTDVTNQKEINIGKPLGNTQMYILDTNLNPVPIGVAGELYIAGDGVGKGYLNREDITKERYLKNPFKQNSIMYKTGDLCKFDCNGEIFCLGRLDNQVKIRGLRIELDEIENKILDFPYVKKAKVVKQLIGNREIISAYYISSKRIKVAELRKYLYEVLPKYMIPSYFTALDEFPYTPNGKIDKNALPIPDNMQKAEISEYVKPQTDLQNKLVTIWEDILNTKPIGIKDNFFELGGDSILAMNLNIRILKFTNKIKYSDIFTYPTISELAEKIDSNKEELSNQDLSSLTKKYSKILNTNMSIPKDISPKSINNVLLTGATGFLGIHILAEFLETEKGKIYVLIRKDPGSTIQEKLLDKLHYYFGNIYDKEINNRIILVEGDITKDNFGLNQEDITNLGKNINCIINSAAKVSHYGSYKDFYKANVKSVENIITFTNAFNIKLFHISTLSVSGNAFVDQYYMEQHFKENVEYCENNFYIGQNLENVYIKSKFEAERIILDNIFNGTEAYILRIGNLMPRLSDGIFQENISENAYINRIRTFIKLKCIPDYLLDNYLEFTPIDSTAKAILKIMKYTNKENCIYHIFNHNHVYLKDLLKMLNGSNFNINVISNDDFKKKIKEIIKNTNSDDLNTLINDLDKNLNLNYDSKIKLNSTHTIKILQLFGFEWPKIDKSYINNILKLIEGE